MAGTSDQIANFIFGTKKPYDLVYGQGSSCTAFLHFDSRTNPALAVHLAMLIEARWVTDMDLEPVDCLRHLSDAVRTLEFVFFRI